MLDISYTSHLFKRLLIPNVAVFSVLPKPLIPETTSLRVALQDKGPTLEEAVKGSDMVHEFTQDLGEEKAVHCRVLHSIPATASEALRTLHARIHPLLMFYIDACSGLQQDDANMNLLLLVKYSEDKPVAVLGMLTYFVYAPHLHELKPLICMQHISMNCISFLLFQTVTKFRFESLHAFNVW